MEIGGFQGLSLIDYPTKMASIVFLAGCNMRCPFCHNSTLVFKNYEKSDGYAEENILRRLANRKDFVEAVVITGGEPTLHSGLKAFIEKCKKLGLLVKLDTNGSNPKIIRDLLEEGVVDYIAMDIKAELKRERYKKAIGIAGDCLFENIVESIKVIRDSEIGYEFRTTVVPSLVELDDLAKIAKSVEGAKAYYLQQFVPAKTLDPRFSRITPYPTASILAAAEEIKKRGLVKRCEVRGE